MEHDYGDCAGWNFTNNGGRAYQNQRGKKKELTVGKKLWIE